MRDSLGIRQRVCVCGCEALSMGVVVVVVGSGGVLPTAAQIIWCPSLLPSSPLDPTHGPAFAGPQLSDEVSTGDRV